MEAQTDQERVQSLAKRLHDESHKGDVLSMLHANSLILDQFIEKLGNFMQAPLASKVTRLFDAAREGDVPALLNLLEEDPVILDRCITQNSGCILQSPIHVAASAGHYDFTAEILNRKPELAGELDQSKGSSPLHMASAKGHLKIVETLLKVEPNMCFARNRDGLNPVHVAATNGQIQVINALLQSKPEAARDRTNHGETVLHLCVKHNQAEALRVFINVTDDGELLNSRDSDDNTVLHLAVSAKHLEIVKFLLKHKKMEKITTNRNGSTAMDVLFRSRNNDNDRKIWEALKRAKVLRASDTSKTQNRRRLWLEKQRGTLMMVACQIATMAFQVGTNPPGGNWQDENNDENLGTSIMADKNPGGYQAILIGNTIALISSLSVILLLISGLPCKRLFVVILMITMWIAVTATTWTYYWSVNSLLPETRINVEAVRVTSISFGTWAFLMVILILGNAYRIIVKFIRQLKQFWKYLHARATNRLPD